MGLVEEPIFKSDGGEAGLASEDCMLTLFDPTSDQIIMGGASDRAPELAAKLTLRKS